MTPFNRLTFLSCLMVWAFFFGPNAAIAANNPTSCTNDIDCVATPQCGGDVCTYTASGSMTCTPAGTGPKGADGWCTVDTDCKCYAQGARCNVVYCTFTTPSNSIDGSAGETGNKGETGSGDAGREGNTGGTSATGSGGGGGGCDVAGHGSPLDGWPGVAALAPLVVTRYRRRRRLGSRQGTI